MPSKSALLISWFLWLFPGAVLAAGPPLELETKIPLGDIKGRIDHFAIDLERQRLFVAELGNDSVGVIDLKTRKVMRTIAGLNAPQGLGYVRSTDTLYVANAGDGSVRLFKGADLVADGRIDLGDDADNIRLDARSGRVYVGCGDGALAAVDPATRAKIADIPLKGHPESFQIDPAGRRIFANVPDAKQIAVIDIASAKQAAAWPTGEARANFPMTFDGAAARVIVAIRETPRLMAYDTRDGHVVADLGLCGDSDDLFVDAKRQRLYAACGEGVVEVFEQRGSGYVPAGRVPTATGARTALLVPEMDRLFVAVRAVGGEPAAIWVFRPTP
jgi:YVTN family beta-propeller protein